MVLWLLWLLLSLCFGVARPQDEAFLVAEVSPLAPVEVSPLSVAPAGASPFAPIEVSPLAPVEVSPLSVAPAGASPLAPVEVFPLAPVEVFPLAPVEVFPLAPVEVSPLSVAPAGASPLAPVGAFLVAGASPLVEDEVFPLVEDEVFPLLLFFRPLDQQGDNIFWQHLLLEKEEGRFLLVGWRSFRGQSHKSKI